MEIFILVGKKERRKGMKPLRKYVVYLENDWEQIVKIGVPAENEEAARKYLEGRGTIVKIDDVSEKTHIPRKNVEALFMMSDFSKVTTGWIIETLRMAGIIF